MASSNQLYLLLHNDKIIARQQLKETYIRNGEGYAVKRKYFVENKNVLKNNGFVVSKNFSWSIDSLFDLNNIVYMNY